MKKLVFLAATFFFLVPGTVLASGEWAEVQQMFQACINSGGRAASTYEGWVNQNGCICPGSSTGSGQRTCSGASGSSGSSDSSGNLVTDSTKNVVQGIMNGNSQQMGIGMMGIGAAALIQGMQGDPAADARRRAAEAARAVEQRRQAEEEAREAEATKERLLGETKSSDPNSLSLMGVEPAPDLQLMTGDASIGPPTGSSPTNNAAATPVKHSEAFTKGFQDASQCYSQNAGPYCSGITGNQWQVCLSDYRSGYQVGDKQRLQILDEAYRVGQSAGANGLLADAASDPRAAGGCRTQWIEAYNRGYFQGKQAQLGH
ncbi:MAG: hypothetical protein ACYC9K_00550 [Sulfuricaulis sp.]